MAEFLIGEACFSTRLSCWREFLYLDVLSDGCIELTSYTREVLAPCNDVWHRQDVGWPKGFDPNDIDVGTEIPDPVSIGGKQVVAQEDDFYVGEDLELRSEESTAVFERNDLEGAIAWLGSYFCEAKFDDEQHVYAVVRNVFKSDAELGSEAKKR